MLQVVFMDNPPFVCPDWSPCQPSYLENGWKYALNTSDATCLFGGLRTRNGVCIHGLKVEMFKMLLSRISGFGNGSMLLLTLDAISLWYTNSTITEGTDNIVSEIFSPGSSGIHLENGLCGNSSCDMAFGDFTVNWSRQKLPNARFSKSWMMGGYQILARQKTQDDFYLSTDFISPFQPSLWFIIIGMLMGLSVMVTLVETASARKVAMRLLLLGSNKIQGAGEQENTTTEMGLTEGFWFGFQTLFATQDNGTLETKLARALVWCWQLSVIAILSTYTATYTNIISSKGVEWAIGESLGTGSEAYTTLGVSVQACPHCISVQKGGAAEKYLNGTLRMDFTKVHDEHALQPHTLSCTIEKIRNMMENQESIQSVWIDKTASMKYITEQVVMQTAQRTQVCNWKTVGAEFGIGMQAILYAPSLPHSIAGAIDMILIQLTEDLSLRSLENQWIRPWTQCLLTPHNPWKPMEPRDFRILFMVVSSVAFFGVFYRFITDYSITVQINPENHGTMQRWFFNSTLGKLLFGVDIKTLDRPYSSHALLCEVRRSLMQGAATTDEAMWVRKYSSSKGVYFFVNMTTGEHSWTGPTMCVVRTDRRHRRVAADHYRPPQDDENENEDENANENENENDIELTSTRQS